jgi:hypothetical protein
MYIIKRAFTFIVIFYHTPWTASEGLPEKSIKKERKPRGAFVPKGCSPLQKQTADENPFNHYAITKM